MNKYYVVTEFSGGGESILLLEDHPKWGVYQSLAGPFASEDMAREKCKIHDKSCVSCGKLIGLHYVPEVRDKLLRLCLCFDCNFWTERLGLHHAHSRSLIIEGAAYMAHKGKGDGFGGRKFIFRKLPDGEPEECENLWHQGNVPALFRGRFPDNAEFISANRKP